MRVPEYWGLGSVVRHLHNDLQPQLNNHLQQKQWWCLRHGPSRQAARHRRPARRRELEAKLLSLRGVLFTAARLAEEADVVIRDLALTMFPASSRLFRENPYE